jgi:hypothetical protein
MYLVAGGDAGDGAAEVAVMVIRRTMAVRFAMDLAISPI